MKYYEIRVFNRTGKTTLVYHRLYSGDQAAIDAGKEIAGDRAFDLWRGMECIFAAEQFSQQVVQ